MSALTEAGQPQPKSASRALTGNEIIARCLKERGIEVVYFLMGGPMLEVEQACADLGIRMLDVRHEQAAVMMGNGYSRLLRRPSVCMAASGPGVMNLVTGIAHAWADGAPVVAIGGAAPTQAHNTLTFQEVDQVAVFKPITVWADRVYTAERIPEYIDMAFHMAFGSRPGPVYLDVPWETLAAEVPEDAVRWTEPRTRVRPFGDPAEVDRAVQILEQAERPVLVYGSGVLWSEAEQQLSDFVDATGIPFYATPQARGAVAEDHPASFLATRGRAFRETDVLIEVATRQSYVIDHARGSRWNREMKLIQIDIDPVEIGRNRHADAAIMADAGAGLEQLLAAVTGRISPNNYSAWTDGLREENERKLKAAEERLSNPQRPIHPLRLCKEIRDVLPRDAVLVVDGQEILNFARQSIPFYEPHSLNSGPFGTMGVGLPLGIGAKIARPDLPVLVLHGDGSFGFNAMEMDTALRHDIPIVVVISLNGGWTSTNNVKVGRDLGYTRYDLMFGTLGAHTEFVEDPDRIGGAIRDAFASGKPAVINVVTDHTAEAPGVQFGFYST
jgi:acetolactate synthase-1/2/3 large subunit